MADPYCLAMVLCDNIHIDATTGKRTILGTFSTLGAKEYPTKLRFAIYYAITDAEGEFDISFRMVDSAHVFEDTGQPVFELSFPVKSPSPLAVHEGQIMLGAGGGIVIPNPGVYHCEILCGGNVLMSRRLVAVKPSDLQGDK